MPTFHSRTKIKMKSKKVCKEKLIFFLVIGNFFSYKITKKKKNFKRKKDEYAKTKYEKN